MPVKYPPYPKGKVSPHRALLAAGLSILLLSLACNFTPLIEPQPTPAQVVLPSQPAVMTIQPALQPTLPGGVFLDTPAPTATPQVQTGPQGKIVFTCQIFEDQKRNQVCYMNADGSDQVRLTHADDADHLFASFAPDGQSIFLSANLNNGVYQIYESDLAGTLRQVTTSSGASLAPALSPDGTRIVFTYQLANNQTIWVINRDGTDAHPVEAEYQGDGWDPVWSPDGSQILFASNRTGPVQLYVIKADGSELRQVTEISGIRGRSDWAPDGATLATYVGERWVREIYLFDASGENPRPITSGGNNLAPSFSPDGQWIAYTSYRDGYMDNSGCEIYTMRVDGTQVTRLTNNTYCDWQPRWGK